ncbi:MAG: hypothetical protein HYT30_01225 [Parcubacteria group bacterium]|nr:hypothetical protein [Parcubacteria group bacterium]
MGGGAIANVCGGLKCGDQPEGASDAGAQKAMEMAKQLMDALKSKSGGGGGGAGGETPPFENTPPPPPDAANFNTNSATSTFGSIFNTGTNSTASFTQTAAQRITNAAADIFSSIVGGAASEQANNANNTDASALKGSQPVVGSTQAERNKNSKRDPKDDIITRGKDDAVAMNLTSFFDRFFGRDEQMNNGVSFFGRLCTARPWQASLVARVLSENFFDSLCARQGFALENGRSDVFNARFGSALGGAELTCPHKAKIGDTVNIAWNCGATQSVGLGFDTGGSPSGSVALQPEDTAEYQLRCGNGGRARCLIEIERPRAEITAYPALVRLGARTEIFWTSEHVASCVIEGPGLKELGVRGAATTPVILTGVTYTIVCHDEAGREARDSVTVEAN